MEAVPPSYASATVIDIWHIIAPYIPSADLCSALLVCSRWHATFAPHLWGNPASHFGIENDAVYVALTRFRKTLQTARLFVRSLTHTMHLPPAHAELYNGPHSHWLRDIIARLPNLQSLIVRGLPFFDYAALQALVLMQSKSEERYDLPTGVIELPASRGHFYQRPRSPVDRIPSFSLRLLDASRCPNVTSTCLAAAISRFEGLLYLDLSFSYPARDPSVLTVLAKLAGLQVLKLRGVSLKDDSIEVLASSIGLRVRSLDIRDNQVTDRGVRILLDYCFARQTAQTEAAPTAVFQHSPNLLPYLGSEMLDIYQGEDFEAYLRNAFTDRFVSRLAIEDAPSGGITHLYIARNALTVEGISGLVRSGRLHVLDVGSVAGAKFRQHLNFPEECYSDSTVPGAEKLAPVLAAHAADCLTFLRIDHSLITKETPRTSAFEAIVHDRVELADTAMPLIPTHAAELDGSSVRPEAFELAADERPPQYELEGQPVPFVVSPAVDDTYKVDAVEDILESASEARRDSDLAPEVVNTISRSTLYRTHLNPGSAFGEDTMITTANGLATAVSSVGSPAVTPPCTPRPRTYSSMNSERQARLRAQMAAGHSLHPAMLPHLTTLVLTNLPQSSSNPAIADRIIRFVKRCAEETAHARSQAQLDYSLPPGRKGHTSALNQSANKIFALKRLVLEVAPEDGERSRKASPWQHQETRSMTNDRDSEALWDAAATDFSFFGEEENMFPTIEAGLPTYNVASEKEVDCGQAGGERASSQPLSGMVSIDTIAALSRFRKERKLAHDRKLAAGAPRAETEGFWDGVIQVVRSHANMRSDEELDYYGNRFTNNYLYR